MDSNDRLLHCISYLVNDCPDTIRRWNAAYALGVLEAHSDVTLNLDNEEDYIVTAYEAGRVVGQENVFRAKLPTAVRLAACEDGDECPLCENGTVSVTDNEVRCMGECGATAQREGGKS